MQSWKRIDLEYRIDKKFDYKVKVASMRVDKIVHDFKSSGNQFMYVSIWPTILSKK